MNEQFILQRIDLLESHIRELQRKHDEDIKWKFVVQKWISQNFEFSVHKQLQRPDFLNFNYDPPSACELLGKNIATAPQLHTLFRRQQEEFGRVLRYVNMNAVNHSTNSSSSSIHPNQCCQGLPNYPNPHQTFPNLPQNQNFPINHHKSYPNPHQGFPVNPHQGFPNPHPSFSIPHQNLSNPVVNSSSENQNFTNSHQSQSQQEQQKASKQLQGQHKRKSFENQPQLKRSAVPMRIPETLTASLVPPAEQLYHSRSFTDHVTTCVPAPNNNPGLNPNSGADRFPSSSNVPQSFGPPQPQCLSSSLQKMSPQVLGDGSGRSSPSEVEVISVNQSQRQQQASEANPHLHSRHISASSGPGSNSNSNSNLSPAMAGTGSHNNNVHNRAPDPTNFSQFINDISRMCEPLNPNPVVGPPVNFGPAPTPTMHLDQYTCNQCHLILPNKHVADMHFEAVHSFPPRPLYSYPNFNQLNQTHPPYQLPPPAPLPSRPQSKTKNKFDQLQKRHSSNSMPTVGAGATNLPHADVHSQAQTLTSSTNMPQSIPVLQPQIGQAQSAHDNNSDPCEEASFIKIVSIQSGGKRYVRKADHQNLGGNRHPGAVVGFNAAQAQPLPPPYPEEKHRRKRKNVVLDEITLSDNDEPNENPNNVFHPGNLTPPFTSESESRDSNEQNQIIGLESELSGHPARSPPFAMSPHHVVSTYSSVINHRDSLGKSPHLPLAGSPLARCTTSRSRNSIVDTNLISAEQGRSDSRPGACTLTNSPIISLVAAVESEPIIVAPEINLYTSSLDLEESSSNSTSNFNANTEDNLSIGGNCRNADALQQHPPSRSPPISSSNMHNMLSTSTTSSQQTRNFDSYVTGVHNNIRTNVVHHDMMNNYGSGQGQESQSVLVREPADNYLAVLDNEEVEMDMDFKPCVHIL